MAAPRTRCVHVHFLFFFKIASTAAEENVHSVSVLLVNFSRLSVGKELWSKDQSPSYTLRSSRNV